MYLDILLLQNLIYDYLILCGVAILMGTTLTKGKAFVALLASVGLSFICFVLQLNVILSVVPFLVVWLAFRPRKIAAYIKFVVYFYCVSIMISGGIYTISHFISFKLTPFTYMIVLFILSVILTIIYVLKEQYMSEEKQLAQFKYSVEFLVVNQMVSGIGYVDTGNHLKDQVTLEPIMMVPKSYLTKEDIEVYLQEKQVNWWYTTYCVVNEKPKLLRVFRPTYLMVNSSQVKEGLIGIVEESFPSYDFLLQPEFVRGTIENKGENNYARLHSIYH